MCEIFGNDRNTFVAHVYTEMTTQEQKEEEFGMKTLVTYLVSAVLLGTLIPLAAATMYVASVLILK